MLPVAAAPAVQGSVMSLRTGYGCNNGTVQGGSEERLEGRADCSPSMRVYSLYTKGYAGASQGFTRLPRQRPAYHTAIIRAT